MRAQTFLIGAAVALGAACGMAATANAAGPVSVTYYTGYNETSGVGIAFTGEYMSDTISSISELKDYGGVNTDPNWPNGDTTLFGADFQAKISAPADGSYTFGFESDDAGYVFIDGALVASQPGTHALGGIQTFTANLTKGANTLEIQYDNNEFTQASVVFNLADGTSFGAVPEPSVWGMMLLGFGGLGAAMRSRRKQVVATA